MTFDQLKIVCAMARAYLLDLENAVEHEDVSISRDELAEKRAAVEALEDYLTAAKGGMPAPSPSVSAPEPR